MSRSSSLLQARYGENAVPEHAPWSPVLESLLGHRSVRAYLDRPLPEGTLETLLAAAQSAATSSNQQAWSVIAVRDPVRKARLAELASNQAHIRQAPLLLVWLADFSRVQRRADAREVTLEAAHYLDSLLTASIDAALAAQNAVVALESLGLGSVYIGALRNHLAAVIEELALPPLVYPVFGLCVGYPDPARPAAVKPRLPQGVVLHHEHYAPAEDEAAQIAGYDSHIADFYRSQGLPTPDWSGQAVERQRVVDVLHGRGRNRDVLNGQQLGLR